MWRRVSSLTQFVSPTKSSSILNQPDLGIIHHTDTQHVVSIPWVRWILIVQQGGEKGGISFKDRIPFITFVLGGPGSGKGTQCEKIVETFGFKHLSAGDLLRREIASKSEYGSMILNTIKDGRIVPSEVTIKLIQKEMESSDNKKFLIDGFPRCEENRVAFEQIIGAEPNVVLFFDCPVEEMVKRVLNRNQGRVDDNMDTIKKRLKVFEALNLPVVNYYAEKGKLHKICALGTEDEIFEQVWPVFAACKQVIQ